MRAGQRAPASLLLSHLMEVPQGPASAPCASLGTPLQEARVCCKSLSTSLQPPPRVPPHQQGPGVRGGDSPGSSGIWDKYLSGECY